MTQRGPQYWPLGFWLSLPGLILAMFALFYIADAKPGVWGVVLGVLAEAAVLTVWTLLLATWRKRRRHP